MPEDALLRDIDACVDALGTQLPLLTAQYSPLAVVVALSLHVNAALAAAVNSGHCSKDKARILIRSLTRLELDAGPFDNGR